MFTCSLILIMCLPHSSFSSLIIVVPYLLLSSQSTKFILSQDIPDLHPDHYPFYFQSQPSLYEQLCRHNSSLSSSSSNLSFKLSQIDKICLQVKQASKKCWGFESSCPRSMINFITECNGEGYNWAKTKAEQKRIFYNQADFGYIQERIKEIKEFCKPTTDESIDDNLKSSLRCSKYFRFCKANNIMIDFQKLTNIQEPMRYRDDVLKDGLIGGLYCKLDDKGISQESGHKSPLQSWFEELEHYTVFNLSLNCDLTISKPTFIMKLDATVNMYHHFCDFINLYASLFVNNSFNMDNNILIWDTFPYRSNFGIMWNAFTSNSILNLNQFRGKKVCFQDVVFPFLPRMIFGLYYNMPLIPGCSKSALFQAFNRHILHKLKIESNFTSLSDQKVIRITFISRKTQFRQILNEDEMIDALSKYSKNFKVNKVNFNHKMPFYEQLAISANSDILIGIHGAGLTHTLFQPDWGVLFELYNCNDESCYKDLARLRGVKYLTWTEEDKIFPQQLEESNDHLAHEKFTNYRFDVNTFIKLVAKGARHVRKERKVFFEKHIHSLKLDICDNCDHSSNQHNEL